MSFTLEPLPYAVDALAPYISAETMELHHGRHHRSYVDNLNRLVPGTPFEGLDLEALVRASYGKNDAICNNAGQHWNHAFFWPSLRKDAGAVPARLAQRLADSFGSVEAFMQAFATAGAGQFGSGWAWLVEDRDGRLAVTRTPNGENPLVHGQRPLLGCDVWEHAYYVDYRNRRPDYLKAFLDHVVDWTVVDARLG